VEIRSMDETEWPPAEHRRDEGRPPAPRPDPIRTRAGNSRAGPSASGTPQERGPML
jgi:hypothetical protein